MPLLYTQRRALEIAWQTISRWQKQATLQPTANIRHAIPCYKNPVDNGLDRDSELLKTTFERKNKICATVPQFRKFSTAFSGGANHIADDQRLAGMPPQRPASQWLLLGHVISETDKTLWIIHFKRRVKSDSWMIYNALVIKRVKESVTHCTLADCYR